MNILKFLFILFILIFVVLNFVARDIPPPDDHDLRISEINIPSEENAYIYLLKASDNLLVPEGMEAIEVGNLVLDSHPDMTLIEEIIKRNNICFEYLDKVIKAPYFVSPEIVIKREGRTVVMDYPRDWGKRVNYLSNLLFLNWFVN